MSKVNEVFNKVKEYVGNNYDIKNYHLTGFGYAPIEEQCYLEYTNNKNGKIKDIPLNKKDNEWFIENLSKDLLTAGI